MELIELGGLISLRQKDKREPIYYLNSKVKNIEVSDLRMA
jgi:hypothetical protein